LVAKDASYSVSIKAQNSHWYDWLPQWHDAETEEMRDDDNMTRDEKVGRSLHGHGGDQRHMKREGT
jgi:hypothetical protein